MTQKRSKTKVQKLLKENIKKSQRRENWRQTETRFDAQWAAAAPATAQFSWKVRQIEIFDSDIDICMSCQWIYIRTCGDNTTLLLGQNIFQNWWRNFWTTSTVFWNNLFSFSLWKGNFPGKRGNKGKLITKFPCKMKMQKTSCKLWKVYILNNHLSSSACQVFSQRRKIKKSMNWTRWRARTARRRRRSMAASLHLSTMR